MYINTDEIDCCIECINLGLKDILDDEEEIYKTLFYCKYKGFIEPPMQLTTVCEYFVREYLEPPVIMGDKKDIMKYTKKWSSKDDEIEKEAEMHNGVKFLN